jgi:M3 family oligoendopeptidase
MHFSEYAPPEPSSDQLRAALTTLTEQAASAASAEDLAGVIAARDEALRPAWSWIAHTSLAARTDTRDDAIAARKERADALRATLEQLHLPFARAALGHPAAATLPAQLRDTWAADVRASDPAIEADRRHEQRLVNAYMKLCGRAEFEFEGRTWNLSTIDGPATAAERSRRQGAERARWGWFDRHRGELDSLFGELVSLRSGMARKLGHDDFVATGYLRMHRVDYGPEQVASFRAQVREHVVPLAAELRREQAARLGVDRLMLWDESVLAPEGNPVPVSTDELLGAGRRATARLQADLAAFYAQQVDDGYVDMVNRDGKAPGAFCTTFSDLRRPFVFGNASGLESDVRTLLHEFGHAYQKHCSRDIEPADLVHASADGAEIHSMALEFLAWPVFEDFFGEQAERARRNHLVRALFFLPYGLLVDEFQHRIYAEPELSPAQRHEVWAELEAGWLPWRDAGDLPHVSEGGFWQRQLHIYLHPFYYVDYCLAQTVALQFWALAQQDGDDAMRRYRELCARGGTLPFQGLVRSTGLRSPLDEGAVAGVVQAARAWLGG